uniref:Fibrinogen gamma chain n=1 Tax=Lates calcarifer TaxID=8187 RepID=A0A4W6EU71_LATCA
MAPHLATAGGLLLLFSFSSAQIQVENLTSCTPNDGFGKYCPTACGVADYLLRYMPGGTRDLDYLQRELKVTASLTQGAEEKKSQDTSHTTRICFPLSSELKDLISSDEKRLADLKQLSNQLKQKCSNRCQNTVQIQPITGADCQDIANKGVNTSGIYYVKPAKATEQFLVYCEIDNFGRGFTVIQRRRDGSVDFNKNWIQYKEGFGYLAPNNRTEFWLGNEKIHQLTASSIIPTVLRIELVDWEGNKRYADYNMFRLGPEVDMYRLTYGYYFGGDAGDAFDGFDFGDDPSDKFYTSHNGMQFSTPDKDNDKYDGNCAQQDGCGWWMNRCHAANLNGKYYQGGRYTEKDAGEYGYDNGIIWVTWHNRWYSLKETTMKLIPLTHITAKQ